MKKIFMNSNMIGFLMMIPGIYLSQISMWFFLLAFIGVILFGSFHDTKGFCDYIIADSDTALVRKRHYFVFFPFEIVLHMLTFGHVHCNIFWKDEYFKMVNAGSEERTVVKIPRAEYILLRDEQRQIYQNETLSKEFMERCYTVEGIGFKRKKRRVIIVSILASIILTILTDPEPGALYMVLLYEAIFAIMLFLWIPEYKDAKILQNAYDRAVKADNQ